MPPSFHSDSAITGTILVVDDEPAVLAIAAAILNTIDVTPLKARNGEDALATVKAHYASGQKISLVVQDLTMPGGMSGFETMENLRIIDPNIHVIACSGFFQDGALELCQSIGFSNILAKPYTPDSLLGLIRRTLHEGPPPPVQLQSRTLDPVTESPACFAPAASATPYQPGYSPGFSSSDIEDDEEEDEPALSSSVQTSSSTPSATQEAPTTEAPRPRRPSFLASALAQSIRSRLQPHQDSSETSTTTDPSSQPSE
jgi:CheY-like chemotaxis protein